MIRHLVIVVLLSVAGCAKVAPRENPTDGGAARNDMRGAPSPCGTCPPIDVCDAKAKRCVRCLVDGDCPKGDRCVGNSCVLACGPGGGCGDAGVCNQDGGICGGCGADSDCKDPGAPFCSKASGACVACSPDNDRCPMGQYCGTVAGKTQCTMGCKADGECADGMVAGKCCGHACVDTAGANDNCGACANACGMGSSCCDSSCVDTTSDPANCGGCGAVCRPQNASGQCAGGTCSILSCDNNFDNCNQNAADGCETQLGTKSDCGGCGDACFFACLGGACFPF